MRSRLVPALVLILSLVAATGARAQQARLDITINNVQACDFSANIGLVTATVKVINAFPFQTVRFKAPVPCGMVFLNDSSGYLLAGDSQTGVTVTLPACTNAPVDVLTIQAFATAAVSNCSWDVAPADGDADILLTDCDGYVMKGASARYIYCQSPNTWIAPYRPDPPNGATNVPLNAVLSYVGSANVLNFGTLPPYDTPTVCISYYPSILCDNPYDPGMLQPNTTYYWSTTYWCGVSCYEGEGAYSDNWSFTTADVPLAVEQTTWGHVKALYRQ